MKMLQIGLDPEFDKRVAIAVLEMLAIREDRGLKPFIYGDIIGELNKSDLRGEHPQRLFSAAQKTGYVNSILTELNTLKLIRMEAMPFKGVAGFGTTHAKQSTYHITKEGREVLNNIETLVMPPRPKRVRKKLLHTAKERPTTQYKE